MALLLDRARSGEEVPDRRTSKRGLRIHAALEGRHQAVTDALGAVLIEGLPLLEYGERGCGFQDSAGHTSRTTTVRRTPASIIACARCCPLT